MCHGSVLEPSQPIITESANIPKRVPRIFIIIGSLLNHNMIIPIGGNITKKAIIAVGGLGFGLDASKSASCSAASILTLASFV